MTKHIGNRQYRLLGPAKGALVAADMPEPGPNQALIRVRANGVCASDLATWRRGDQPAVPLGHEPVCQIVECGPGIDLAQGTWVTGRITATYADYAVADAQDLVVVPDQLDPMTALGEPLGCVVEAYRRTRLLPGDHVAIIGLGFMGLLYMSLLTRSPIATITAIDPRDDARATARARGASFTYPADRIPDKHLTSDSDAHKFDVVIEASGSSDGLELATTLVTPHGVLCLLGYHQGPRHVDLRTWNWKAIDVVNGHIRDRDRLRDSTSRGLTLAAHQPHLDLAALITHRYGFHELDRAFQTLQAKPPGFIKALVVTAD